MHNSMRSNMNTILLSPYRGCQWHGHTHWKYSFIGPETFDKKSFADTDHYPTPFYVHTMLRTCHQQRHIAMTEECQKCSLVSQRETLANDENQQKIVHTLHSSFANNNIISKIEFSWYKTTLRASHTYTVRTTRIHVSRKSILYH